jgi:hypothetical protein
MVTVWTLRGGKVMDASELLGGHDLLAVPDGEGRRSAEVEVTNRRRRSLPWPPQT